MNVLGEPIDEAGPIEAREYWPIHRKPPTLSIKLVALNY